MNATNRVVNRMVLLVIGLLLAAVGAAVVLLAWSPPWSHPVRAVADDAVAPLRPLWDVTVTLPLLGIDMPAGALYAAGAALLLIALLTVFLCTRGGGRRRTVLDLGGPHGRTRVDREVARAVLADAIAARPDVLSARLDAYTVKRDPAIDLVVRMRRGADPSRVIAAVERVVEEWDALAGRRLPVLVHLADRTWRDRLR